MEGVDAELLAADGDILGGQHSGVWGGLVTIGLNLHATSDTGDGLTAAGITQVSLWTFHQVYYMNLRERIRSSGVYIRKIGNVDKGIVEGSEDTGNAKDELACETVSSLSFVARILDFPTYHRGPVGRGRCSPGLGGKPSLVAFWR